MSPWYAEEKQKRWIWRYHFPGWIFIREGSVSFGLVQKFRMHAIIIEEVECVEYLAWEIQSIVDIFLDREKWGRGRKKCWLFLGNEALKGSEVFFNFFFFFYFLRHNNVSRKLHTPHSDNISEILCFFSFSNYSGCQMIIFYFFWQRQTFRDYWHCVSDLIDSLKHACPSPSLFPVPIFLDTKFLNGYFINLVSRNSISFSICKESAVKAKRRTQPFARSIGESTVHR